MKFLLTLTLSLSSLAFAQSSNFQQWTVAVTDETLASHAAFEQCLLDVTAIATVDEQGAQESIRSLREAGIISVTLTRGAAEKVAQLPCVLEVRTPDVLNESPSVIRRN